jgi:hypothetical protein
VLVIRDGRTFAVRGELPLPRNAGPIVRSPDGREVAYGDGPTIVIEPLENPE